MSLRLVHLSDTHFGFEDRGAIEAASAMTLDLAPDLTLVTGSSTSSNFRFGDFSSVSIDPASGGLCAVTAQEYFNSSGQWVTRIARTCF